MFMAAPKKPYSSLSKTARYYRNNKKARAVKAAYSKHDEKKSENVKSRVELIRENRKRKKNGKSCKKHQDLSHVTRNGKKTLVCKSSKSNRGDTNDSAGDKRARGKKRTKKK